jgi:hypothetical protein
LGCIRLKASGDPAIEHCNFSAQGENEFIGHEAEEPNHSLHCNFSVNEGDRFVSFIFVPHLDAKIAVTPKKVGDQPNLGRLLPAKITNALLFGA